MVGRIGRPHGTGGDVVVHPETDNPQRFVPGARMIDSSGRALVVRSVKKTKGPLLVRFESIEDRVAAEELRGLTLRIPVSERRSLRSDEFWPDELVGLEVRDPDGAVIGVVKAVIEGPAQERLLIRMTGGTSTEVPFVTSLVPEVEIAEGYLVVSPTEGLI